MKKELKKLSYFLKKSGESIESEYLDSIGIGDFSNLDDTNITKDEAFSAGYSAGLEEDEMTPGEAVGVGYAISESKHHKSSYMAKPQLASIVEMSKECFHMIGEDEEIDDWMESYIAQVQQMLSSVHKKLKYKNNKYDIH